MPESVSGVDAIVKRLREKTHGIYGIEFVTLETAEAAVLAAADARTREIMSLIRLSDDDLARFQAWAEAHGSYAGAEAFLEWLPGEVARRFPNEGTHE